MRIIVVDDDAAVAEALKEILTEGLGHEVVVAGSGADALAMLRHESVNLVFTDRRMPKMSGEELALRIKAEHPSTPIVMVTADACRLTPGEKTTIRAAGVDLVIEKPFQIREIQETLNKVAQLLREKPAR